MEGILPFQSKRPVVVNTAPPGPWDSFLPEITRAIVGGLIQGTIKNKLDQSQTDREAYYKGVQEGDQDLGPAPSGGVAEYVKSSLGMGGPQKPPEGAPAGTYVANGRLMKRAEPIIDTEQIPGLALLRQGNKLQAVSLPESKTTLSHVEGQVLQNLVSKYGEERGLQMFKAMGREPGGDDYADIGFKNIDGKDVYGGFSKTRRQWEPIALGGAGQAGQGTRRGGPTYTDAGPTRNMADEYLGSYEPKHPETHLVRRVLAQSESGGDYTAKNKQGGLDSGKYQYVPDTWTRQSSEFNEMTTGNRTPLPMTKENQDSVAAWKIDQLLLGGAKPEQVKRYWMTNKTDSKLTQGYNPRGEYYDVPGQVAVFNRMYAQAKGGQDRVVTGSGMGGGGIRPYEKDAKDTADISIKRGALREQLKREPTDSELNDFMVKEKERVAAAQASGKLQGLDAESATDRAVIVDMVGNGELSPLDVKNSFGFIMSNKVLAETKTKYPDFNAVAAIANAKWFENPMTQRLIRRTESIVKGHGPDMPSPIDESIRIAKMVNNPEATPVNKLAGKLGVAFGNSKRQLLELVANVSAEEQQQIFGAQGGGERFLELAKSLADPNLSVEQYTNAAKEIRYLIATRQMANTRGTPVQKEWEEMARRYAKDRPYADVLAETPTDEPTKTTLVGKNPKTGATVTIEDYYKVMYKANPNASPEDLWNNWVTKYGGQ